MLEQLDAHCTVIYLEVPPDRVVFLQGLFETYEGLAVVRTLETKQSLVCLLTTPALVDSCRGVLKQIEPEIGCHEVEPPAWARTQLGAQDFGRAATERS